MWNVHPRRDTSEVLPGEILFATSAVRRKADVVYCIHALSRRLAKTRNWTVALKTRVIHRTLREGDPTFREELVNLQQRGRVLQLSNFKDDSSHVDEVRARRNYNKRNRYASMTPEKKQDFLAKKRSKYASQAPKNDKFTAANTISEIPIPEELDVHLPGTSNSQKEDRFKHLDAIPNEAEVLPQAVDCTLCGAMRFYKESEGFCCMKGQIALELPKMPQELWDLYTNQTCPLAKHFRKRCRTYNNTTAFTTLRMTCDTDLCKAKNGFYTVKVNGAVYHQVPELIPQDGFARQLQLFFYGTENEIQNRLAQSGDLEVEVIKKIMNILSVNPYAMFFRRLRDMPTLEEQHIVLRSDPTPDDRIYNLPITDHVAAIWHEYNGVPTERPHDIRVYTHSEKTHYIQYYYGCYDPLQYPLLYPFAEPGWHAGIKRLQVGGERNYLGKSANCIGQHSIIPQTQIDPEQLLAQEATNLKEGRQKKTNVSAREFYCYMFQIRDKNAPNILRAGRLAQQFQIDTYVKIETQRLDFLRDQNKQHEARMESFKGVVDSMANEGIRRGKGIGKRVILPHTFTGGPRDMHDKYMNALALVQRFGKPDLFITMTCNQNWPEIQQELMPREEARNRADLLVRVFRAKNERLKEELIKNEVLGEVAAYFYTIEFQKRGMPHAHWLIVLTKKYKLISSESYDRFVSAEIPDEEQHPHLHSCVAKHMVHGPCGELNEKNVCMKKGSCSKKYPKEYIDITTHRTNSYPNYRRKNDGKKLYVRKHWLDNRWIVPYNPYLLAKFDCHMNVEICSDIKVIKYLYKYVCKGHDKISYSVVQESTTESVDEIKNFQSARWLCAPEAMWRIYGFHLNEMYPTVTRLHVHMPDLHPVWFSAGKSVEKIISDPNSAKTQLTEFFALNAENEIVRNMGLYYHEFPEYFVWNQKQKFWKQRERGIMLGRLVNVSPIEGERYYLRILLKNVKSPTSFENLRTVRGETYSTFREAALERGLLQSDSDTDIRDSLEEEAAYQMPYTMRQLFATILIYNSPSDPKALWEEFKWDLADDLLKEQNTPEDVGFLRALRSIDLFMQNNGRTIDEFKVVSFNVGATREEIHAMEYEHEKNLEVSREDLLSIRGLNDKQKQAFTDITASIETGSGGFFFIDGPGGTGKTYLYRALLASVRSKGQIALAVASSGVAASLLPGGRTAHSRFKLPITIEESMSCRISKQSVHARLILAAKLIIWDEASMAHRRSVETLDLLLRDLTEKNIPFGGITIVFGGDFRQTIPIVIGGSKQDELDACLVNSNLWQHVQKIFLVENMRAREDPVFMEFLLRVGNGTQPYVSSQNIRIPNHMCIPPDISMEPLDDLISFVFPSFEPFFSDPFSVMDRAILTPKNECVHDINNSLIDRFPGDIVEYHSIDKTDDPQQQCQYQDYLNNSEIPGLPPIMLIRNINPTQGQCNGTRLIVRELGKTIIVAQIASGEHKGSYVQIPKIPLEPSDNANYPIPFKRFQFPIRPCFAMTINKAQGQTLERAGIYLPEPVFSHGQLYVALSRVRNSNDIKILIRPPTVDSKSRCETRNVVYKEILQPSPNVPIVEQIQVYGD